MPWPGTLAVVHSYLAHKTGKEIWLCQITLFLFMNGMLISMFLQKNFWVIFLMYVYYVKFQPHDIVFTWSLYSWFLYLHTYINFIFCLSPILRYYWFWLSFWCLIFGKFHWHATCFLRNILVAFIKLFSFLVLAKEEEKNRLLKRSEELKAERVQLEAKAKQLSNAIMVSSEVSFSDYRTISSQLYMCASLWNLIEPEQSKTVISFSHSSLYFAKKCSHSSWSK